MQNDLDEIDILLNAFRGKKYAEHFVTNCCSGPSNRSSPTRTVDIFYKVAFYFLCYTTYFLTMQCNLDLVSLNLVTTYDLV